MLQTYNSQLKYYNCKVNMKKREHLWNLVIWNQTFWKLFLTQQLKLRLLECNKFCISKCKVKTMNTSIKPFLSPAIENLKTSHIQIKLEWMLSNV
jgi:hypothetical protein